MSTHDEIYKTQLSDFFRDLGAEVDASINAYKVELTNFFASLSPALDIAERAQAELDRTAATQFTVFKYFSKQERTQEIYLSRIFGDLLNPSGNHGQGVRFLQLFLDELTRWNDEWSKKLRGVIPNMSLKGCKTHLEFPTPEGRRVDVVLEVPLEGKNDVFRIGIENKPWAGDQDEQIADYLKALLEKSPGNARVLYFSGNGKEPSEAALGKLEKWERDLCLTVPYRCNSRRYPSLENWIQQDREQCEAERVRWFLKDLLEYIKSQFEIPAQTEPETEENKA